MFAMIGKMMKGPSLVTFQLSVVGTIRRDQVVETGRRGLGGRRASWREQCWAGEGKAYPETRSKCVICRWPLRRGEDWASNLAFSNVVAICDLDRTSVGGMAGQRPNWGGFQRDERERIKGEDTASPFEEYSRVGKYLYSKFFL